MFRIKICGITSADDALIAQQAGADAIGLNFYERSVRHVTARVAADIVANLDPGLVKVGVFVNAPLDEVAQTARQLKLDAVQLHGDEPPEYSAALREVAVIRAFRGAAKLNGAAQYLERCRELGCVPAMVLVDAFDEQAYGGTGKHADWAQIARTRGTLARVPLVLAGGLTPANVSAAIAAAQPDAVDTASGVESSPGRKSRDLVTAFVKAARQALA